MIKAWHSLLTKLTASFLLLILLIASMTVFYTYKETKAALKDSVREQLKSVAAVISTSIDGDAMAGLKAGDEEKASFIKSRDTMRKLLKSYEDLKYVYTYKKNKDGKIIFLVDADYGFSDDAAGLMEVYEDTTDEMIKGLEVTAVDSELTTDKWGTFMSGYAPVKNSKGKIVAAVGVDMLAEKVIAKQKLVFGTIYTVIAISIALAGIIILIFSMTIIRDVKKLNRIAEGVSTGNLDAQVDVNRKDEIGELADSFNRMLMSLKIMKMDLEDKGKGK
jgi:methyl-accepting chemotaxis protein